MGRAWAWTAAWAIGAAMVLTGCVETEAARERAELQARVDRQYAMLDAVNALRGASGLGQVTWDARLAAAAEDHAEDIVIQERAWPFGLDRSNPTDRIARWGYPGTLVSEIYAQTASIGVDPLTGWVSDPNWRGEILDPDATSLGFAWKVHPDTTAFWVLTLGQNTAFSQPPSGLQ